MLFSSADTPASSLPPLQTRSELLQEGRHGVVQLWYEKSVLWES